MVQEDPTGTQREERAELREAVERRADDTLETLLYTGHDKAYEELASITVPRMMRWAVRHGCDFECFKEPLLDIPNGIYWTGVLGALEAFRNRGYDRVIYLDVDQLITDLDRKIPDNWICGLHISKDWGTDAVAPWDISACGFIAYRDTLPLFYSIAQAEPKWRDKPFPEQGPMRHVIRDIVEDLPLAKPVEDHDCALINICGRKVFNCVPDEVSPGNVPEPWTPGDWCAHITMLPIEKRIELAKRILQSL